MMGRPMNNDEEDIVLARFPCGDGNVFQFVTHLCFTWVAACESSYPNCFLINYNKLNKYNKCNNKR